MFIPNQAFMVLGVSKSGYAVAKKILECGGKCYLYEDKRTDKIITNLDELTSLGAVYVRREMFEETLNVVDVLVVSPGVPINHEVAVKAKRLGVRIMGELEFGFNCFSPTIVAVTGTNGKTTTCNMIDSVLSCANIGKSLVGNVGVPITSKISEITASDVCVTEVSSFQLETVNALCPHISCILNVAPDHLERHYTMDNYVFLKKRIFKNQKASEFCILNFDDPVVKNMKEEVKCKLIWVSCKEQVQGAYLNEDKLCYMGDEIIDINDLTVKGIHNCYNALYAIACCKILGIDDATIRNGLKEFKGVKHRIENVGEIDGVFYVNDSKATNVASTLTAVNSMVRPTILILGGSEKGESYDPLFMALKDSLVKHIVLTGDSKYAMLDSVGRIGVGNVTLTSDFDCAITIAKSLAKEGDCVLLSPACASFDSFENYEQRGERFCKILGLNFE